LYKVARVNCLRAAAMPWTAAPACVNTLQHLSAHAGRSISSLSSESAAQIRPRGSSLALLPALTGLCALTLVQLLPVHQQPQAVAGPPAALPEPELVVDLDALFVGSWLFRL
jgi:hypothetical protein